MKELYPGDQGIWVQYLQLALQRAGQQVMLDGIFGPKTCAAVEKVMGSSGKCAVKEAQWNRLLPFLRGYITHEVKAGDTFFSIAKMYDTTMERVMHANPGTDAGALQIGSTVVVPFNFPLVSGEVPYTSLLTGWIIEGLQARYPYLQVGTIGRSVMGTPLWSLQLGNGPLCGGEIIATSFGYGCANYKPGDENSCRFSIGKMAEKSFTEAQVRQLLNDGITETMRGFKSKTGKKFDARVALAKDENGKVTGLKFDFDNVEPKKVKDVKCPKCGGDIVVAPFGFMCANHKKDDKESCSFMIGSIASVRLKEAQVKELLTKKRTEVISGFVAKTGMKFDAPLKLTEEGEIAFDFPEKPKPEETTVPCPKCGKMLMKTQWRYECACGFKIWHTVAKVELSEEVMKELLTTGKTKQKIAGFTSKAGNTFDTCLKYENDQISFDFDNPGEAPPEETAAAEETTALEETEESGRKTISNHEN